MMKGDTFSQLTSSFEQSVFFNCLSELFEQGLNYSQIDHMSLHHVQEKGGKIGEGRDHAIFSSSVIPTVWEEKKYWKF